MSTVADILESPLTREALGLAADFLRAKLAGGDENPEAAATAELAALRAGLRASIEASWQAAADAKFGR